MSRNPRIALVGGCEGSVRWSGTPKNARKYNEALSSSMRRPELSGEVMADMLPLPGASPQ